MTGETYDPRYQELLERYLRDSDEKYLLAAAELGREMVAADIPPEEVGAIHSRVLDALKSEISEQSQAEALQRTSAVLLEILMAYGLAFRQQVDHLREQEAALRESEARFRNITLNVPGAIFQLEMKPDGSMFFPLVSTRYDELFDHPREDLLNDAAALRHHMERGDHRRIDKALRNSAKNLHEVDIEGRIKTPSGQIKWMRSISQPRRLDDGSIVWDGIFLDVTEQKQATERIEHLAHHDTLTGLANRNLLTERLESAVARGARYDRQFAVMWIDLDRFKRVNDTFGHEAGDIVLKEVAVRLQSKLRTADTVARMGGDEFVVLVEEMRSREDVDTVAQKILASLDEEFSVNGARCELGASIGIAFFPGDGNDADSLLKNADDAMYRAKGSGRNAYQYS